MGEIAMEAINKSRIPVYIFVITLMLVSVLVVWPVVFGMMITMMPLILILFCFGSLLSLL
jgi:hypothetical protein